MQILDFYPTDTTLYDGIEITKHLLEITGFTDTMADAYLMGYIPADKMPAAFMPVYLSGGVGEMSAIYRPKNTGWGYGWLDTNAEYRYATSFTRVNGSIIARPDFRTQYRLFNAAKMARANTGMQISILFTFAFIDDAVYDGDGGTVDFVQGGLDAGGWGQATQTINYTFDHFADIIKNDLPLFSITKTGNTGVINGKSFTFAPRPSEFGDSNDITADHKYIVDSGQGARAIVFIDGYSISASMAYANGNGGTTTYYLRPFTYPDIDAVGNFDATKAMLFPAEQSNMSQRLSWAYNTDTGIFELTPGNTQTYTIADYNINPGGFNFGTITENDADFTSPTQGRRTLLIKKSLWLNATGYGTRKSGNIQNMYTPMDIYRHALLYHKHTTDGTQISYGDGNTWTTRFDASDAPSGEILTGSFSAIAGNLRPWQLPDVDISANSFTPEDIPADDPGSDAEDTGDSILRPSSISVGGTNGFVTQYVLTAAQIAALGSGLWAGVADRAFWDNWIWTALLEAGTFNVSDILQFFISLRVYPFSLINVTSYQGTGSAALWLGRGTKAIDLGTQDNLGTISQYADILDAGSLNVPAYYGDFRDYDHVSVTLHAPYIGTISLAAGDVVGAALHLFYAIDFASGSCTAYLDISRGGIQYPICIGSGVIGADVPLTADSAARRVAAAVDLGFDTVAGISAVFSGDPLGAAGAAANMAKQQPTVPTLSATGKGFDSFAGAQTAYIQIRRGKYAEGKTPGSAFKSTYGEQLDQPAAIGSFAGFTKFVNVDTAGLQCDAAERSAILTQLQSGVYI